MKGVADIAEVFGIFHDGSIAAPLSDGLSEIVVEIEYLAERLSPSGSSFTIRFDDLERAAFSPWEESGQPALPVIMGLASILPLELEILSAKVVGDVVEVACSCLSLDFPGGCLEIIASGCRVYDASGREWTLEELKKLADDYWDEWSSRGGKPGEGEASG
ncbi:MAG: hypothetical protein EOP83_11345 [Verrucomicrobiaceae bacterium]|nr:MAG: hypothetical protein EOP83_11345 [Verrucomicrobiaceae bacterium]